VSVTRLPVEYRAEIHGNTISGYAAVYDQRTPIRGGWEQIAPGAFDAALRSRPDVVALVDHNPSLLLGRTANGTLRLRSDSRGLAFEVDLPDTSYARDVAELVRVGTLAGASFGFIPGTDELDRAPDGRQVRTHTSVARLVDVSVVAMPAYPGTSVGLNRPLAVAASSRHDVALDNRTRMIRIRHHLRRDAQLRARHQTLMAQQHRPLSRRTAT